MKSHFSDVIRNWANFSLRGFLYQGTLRQKIQAAVSYKLVSYMQVLTVPTILGSCPVTGYRFSYAR